MTGPAWSAEVPIDESPRPCGHGSTPRPEVEAEIVNEIARCTIPISEMSDWLDQRSVGEWRLVRRDYAD